MKTKKGKTNYLPPQFLARTVVAILCFALLVPLGSTNPADKDKKASSNLVIPSGTILPVRLETTLSSSKCQAGQQVTARIMQDVPLPHGSKIREGSKVLGHIVEKTDPAQGGPASISVQFDTLVSSYGTTKLTSRRSWARARSSRASASQFPDPFRTVWTSCATYPTERPTPSSS